MSDLQFAVSVSVAIFIVGSALLALLLFKYQSILLKNFSQKIGMTVSLGLIFILLFVLANFLLIVWLKGSRGSLNLAQFFLNEPITSIWILIRGALGFFVINAFLILAFRSLIKVVSRL